MTIDVVRRRLLTAVGGLSAAGLVPGLASVAARRAAAQSLGDYKALVCVFLYGGNDAYNTVLATDTASWNNYVSVRNQAPDPIALRAVGTAPVANAAAGSPDRLGGVLALNAINAQGRGFAVHPLLTGVRDLFNAGRLAIVPNIGPLVQPTTKADYKNVAFPKPASLFSHNDQQSTWQSLAAEGATTGWGGRMADLLASQNGNAVFSAISASGNAVWLSGQQVMQYQVATSGAIKIGGTTSLFGSQVALQKMRSIMRTARLDSTIARDHAAVVGRSVDAEALYSGALPAANTVPFGTAGITGADPLLQYDNPLTGAKATNPLAL
jgi:uncharacterized protein (DUF1501 family)